MAGIAVALISPGNLACLRGDRTHGGPASRSLRYPALAASTARPRAVDAPRAALGEDQFEAAWAERRALALAREDDAGDVQER